MTARDKAGAKPGSFVPSAERTAAPIVAAACTAALGTIVLALLIEAPLLRSIAAGAVVGAIAALPAALRVLLARRRARVATIAGGVGIGATVLFSEILVVVIAVMFFSH